MDLTLPGVDIPDLLNQCPGFDASVPGVQHMPGGQRAGYARWEAFKKKGLSQYAARRNLAMLRYVSSHLRFCTYMLNRSGYV